MHVDVGGEVPQATQVGIIGFTQRLLAAQSDEPVQVVLQVFPSLLHAKPCGQGIAGDEHWPNPLQVPGATRRSATHVPPQGVLAAAWWGWQMPALSHVSGSVHASSTVLPHGAFTFGVQVPSPLMPHPQHESAHAPTSQHTPSVQWSEPHSSALEQLFPSAFVAAQTPGEPPSPPGLVAQ